MKQYTTNIRLWHWLNAIVISGSLLTVLLNSTIFDVHKNAVLIQNEMHQNGVNVSQEQARTVSRSLEDQVWMVHIYFGYTLAALFLYRIVYGISTKRKSGFFSKLQDTLKLYLTTKLKVYRYELGIKLLYLKFYFLLLLMVMTGFSIVFDGELGLSRSVSHNLKEIHGFCMYLIIGFIVLHIGGVFLAERKSKKGIVSAMINGGGDVD